jgi:hypothetical protein
MQSHGAHGGVGRSVLTPALLEEYWPVARERLVNALGANGVADDVAEEAVAEAATRALGRGLVVADVEDFCRWAFVVARNIAHDATRRSRRTLLLEDVPDRPDEYDLARHVEARDRWRTTARAMEQLSDVDRAVLLGELDPVHKTNRREAMKQAVRRHRARARLRHVLEQLGGWAGWLRRPPWLWPATPSGLSDGLVALALLPLLAAGAPGAGGGNAFDGTAISVPAPAEDPAVATGVARASTPSHGTAASVAGRLAKPASASAADPGPPLQPEGWRFQFTPSPSYHEDHTVFASGGAPSSSCGDVVAGCSLLYVSRDGGGTWALLPAAGRPPGRILLPPEYPRDTRIFSAAHRDVYVSKDHGQSFHLLTHGTGPATMSPLFSAGDERFLFGSDRVQWSGLPMQYRMTDGVLTPLDLPLPPTAAAMELWFAPGYAHTGRIFVTTLEAPRPVDLDGGTVRVAFTIPTMYMCEADVCTRMLDFGIDTLPPTVTQSSEARGLVFVATGRTLHRSTDAGATFQALELPGTERRRSIGTVVAAPDGRVYVKVATGDSVLQLFASDDGGETWELLREDKNAFSNLAVLPDGTLIEGRPSERDGGVRCSTDGGRTWSVPCTASR